MVKRAKSTIERRKEIEPTATNHNDLLVKERDGRELFVENHLDLPVDGASRLVAHRTDTLHKKRVEAIVSEAEAVGSGAPFAWDALGGEKIAEKMRLHELGDLHEVEIEIPRVEVGAEVCVLTRADLDVDPEIGEHKGDGSGEREPAPIGAYPEAEAKLRRSGIPKKRLCALDVAPAGFELRGVRVGEREEALRHGSPAAQLRAHEELTIKAVKDRLSDTSIAQLRMLEVHAEVCGAGAACAHDLKPFAFIKERKKQR